MTKYATIAAALTLTVAAAPAFAQTTTTQSQRDRIGSIFGTLFGDRLGATTSIDAQWAAGRTPLATQRYQFESRLDSEVRMGTLSQTVGTRIKTDYGALVQLEARYGADQRFTTQERADLADRYGALTQVLADRGYGDDGNYGSNTSATADVANGRAEFETGVNTAIANRRITRVEGTRLKGDYAALVQTEAAYLRDGVITDSERDDLDSRLDALDARLGGSIGATTMLTPRARLDTILRALPSSGLSRIAQAQLRVEHQDLSRLDAAYARLSVSAEERAYLDRRLGELEVRARLRR